MLIKKCDVLQDRFTHASQRFDCLLEKERLYNDDIANSFETEIETLQQENHRLKGHCSRLENDNRRLLSSLQHAKENTPPASYNTNPSFC